jgi:hypothetical protein
MEGHMGESMHTKENQSFLFDFLLMELEAARIIHVIKSDLSKTMEVQLGSSALLFILDEIRKHLLYVETLHMFIMFQNESSIASDLKTMLIAFTFLKSPANITPALLFGKVDQKVKYAVSFQH